MSTTTTIQGKAEEARVWFETGRRADDSGFARLKAGAPEWVSELVHEAHGDFLPDDWRYKAIWDALDWIAVSENPEDESGEFADAEVDIYTGARLEWLSSNLRRVGYCDEATAEFSGDGGAGVIELIGMGQYMEAEEVYGLVLSALEDASAV